METRVQGIYWKMLWGAATCRKAKEEGLSMGRGAERSQSTRARKALQVCPKGLISSQCSPGKKKKKKNRTSRNICSIKKRERFPVRKNWLMCMEAKMSAGWRPRRAGGVVLDHGGLRTWWNDVVSLSSRAGEGWYPGLAIREREKMLPSFTFLFYSYSQQMGWCPPTQGRAICFPQSTNSNANVFQKHPHGHIQTQCLIRYPDHNIDTQN